MPPLPDIFLSTLKWVELNRPSRIPVPDKSIMKTKLRIHGEGFTRGMGTQAPSFLTYTIETGYTRFVARCGIDDYLNGLNMGRELTRFPTVIFKVFIDGVLAGESPVMRSSQWAWGFNIPIPPGSRVINLVASGSGAVSLYDYADWVDAGFLKKRPAGE
jgi:hypothetical protein